MINSPHCPSSGDIWGPAASSRSSLTIPISAFWSPEPRADSIDRQIGTDRNTGRPIEAVQETVLFDHVNQVRRDQWRYRAFADDGTIEEEVLELLPRRTSR